MRLVRRPKKTALDVIHYHDMQEALESLAGHPRDRPLRGRADRQDDPRPRPRQHRAVEAHGLRPGRSRRHPHRGVRGRHRRRGPGQGRGARGAAAPASGFGYASPHRRSTPPSSSRSGSSARPASGLLLGLKGEAKPIAFIEDTAVDPKHLPEFVPRFRDIMAKHGADGAYYGHCSVGLPAHPPRHQPQDGSAGSSRCGRWPTRSSTSCSSTAGPSRASTATAARAAPSSSACSGPTIFQAFREFKAAFDPKNRMNPGNIVASPGVTEHLRYGADVQDVGAEDRCSTSPPQGGFAAAVEMCNGVGVCRKKLEGTMCPSYMATRDEEHTTRGRANALRAVLSGQVPAGGVHGRAALRGDGPLPRVQGAARPSARPTSTWPR